MDAARKDTWNDNRGKDSQQETASVQRGGEADAALVKVAHLRGADLQRWFGTFAPVPRALWSAVEVMEHGVWAPVDHEAERAA